MIISTENQSTGRRTCDSATLYVKHSSWTKLKSNSDFKGGNPASNRAHLSTMLTQWQYPATSRQNYCTDKHPDLATLDTCITQSVRFNAEISLAYTT
jgi:hypothetical protein